MRRMVVAALACLASGLAQAEGFVRHDLTEVASEARIALGGPFEVDSHVRRLTLTCRSCQGAPTIDLSIGRHVDESIMQFLTDRTSRDRLRSGCRARIPGCSLTELSVPPAAGLVFTHPAGLFMKGATAYVLRGHDVLTIRSSAGDGATAERNARTLVQALAPRLVGP